MSICLYVNSIWVQFLKKIKASLARLWSVSGTPILAIKDYAHSTAPNRRYSDLITQRLLKAAVEKRSIPNSLDELDFLAENCTKKEDIVAKVERQVSKSDAALLLESRIGERFSAIVTGSAEKGIWVRLLDIPVEGMLKSGKKGIDVGDQITVELVSVDVMLGFIDFKRVEEYKIKDGKDQG